MPTWKFSFACAFGLTTITSAASAQQTGCLVTMPTPFRLLERQAVASGGVSFPARTQVRVISYGSARQASNRAVRARIDTAEGWLFVSTVLLRACPAGSIAERAGDVAAGTPAPSETPSQQPETPARACIPGGTQACLCVGGSSGVQSCAHSGMAWEPCACAAPAEAASEGTRTSAADSSEARAEESGGAGDESRRSTLESVRREMLATLNDPTARQIRALLHPTGGGGAMGRSSVLCRDSVCVGTFIVLWSGGILRDAYQSGVRWIVGIDGSSHATLIGENSVIRADASHIQSMDRYLAGIASRITAH